ncbi:cysteine hydrolase family protein [Nanoarchaeota archaeon]
MVKALLIVDMLNDFVNPDGNLPVAGAPELVENINQIRQAAYEKDMLVVYANDAHAENDPEFEVWPPHCVKGEYGAEVFKQLAPQENDLVLEKVDLSVFTNEKADKELKARGIDELYVTGVATEYCVKGAVMNALELGYKVNLVVDGIAGVDKIVLPDETVVPGTFGAVNNALLEMGNAGAQPVYTNQVLEEMVQ